ncbi:diguanylate cyclase domain-containing protein [Bythopirellula polymerisocia]|uniref:diguanylate cyclase n=1 Tax=Bythopirellula polymerisocia TaxID=2528003 RepID=A0A5C6CTH5_9BACT|nr:diguanylate cyclase [Bythopirellula polymerisocia]TWU27900.1 Response regulator PleD [Bythopirellula polymerisocia]
MLLPLGVSLNYVLLDASLALTAFVVGFIGAYFFTSHRSSTGNPLQPAVPVIDPLDAERNVMAAQQLKDLTTNVASDVGAHSQFVSGISAQLGSLDKNASDHSDLIAEALRQIMSANDKLQTRLEDAESKIKTQAEELKTTQTQAKTDSLTKLANRGAFDEALAKGMDEYRNQGRPMSLLLFDVDHFKKFNDTHGHQAGDEVLRNVAATLKKCAKSSDLACRYGGEEFALVMPNTTVKQASIAAERIRLALEAMKIDFEGKSLNVTASIGVAETGRQDDIASTIRRSDEAIYSAKSAGRNRSYWHDGTTCLPISAPETDQKSPADRNFAMDHKHADLPDRAAFATELQRRISESHRTGADLSVMYLKTIGFGSLERDYGVAVTELVLDSVGQFIGTRLREMDLLGRLERGEFIVMLPGSSKREATIVGNRVRTALANCPIPLGTTQLTLQLKQSVTNVASTDTSDIMIDRVTEGLGVAQKTLAMS